MFLHSICVCVIGLIAAHLSIRFNGGVRTFLEAVSLKKKILIFMQQNNLMQRHFYNDDVIYAVNM